MKEVKQARMAMVASGIDWMTVTGQSELMHRALEHVFDKLASEEERKGYIGKAWNWQGYTGYTAGRASYGEREDSSVLILKSEVARLHANRLNDLPVRITRLDVQITMLHEEHPLDVIEDLLDQVEILKANGEWSRSVKVISDENRPQTFYAGKRGSDWYLRVYDKGIEQGSHEAGHLWRYEVELKGNLARSVYSQLVRKWHDDTASYYIIAGLLHQKGLHFGWGEQVQHIAMESVTKNSVSDVERLITWLSKQVQPAVAKLIARGYKQDVFKALQLPLMKEDE
jgi:DNA relaxase NicK